LPKKAFKVVVLFLPERVGLVVRPMKSFSPRRMAFLFLRQFLLFLNQQLLVIKASCSFHQFENTIFIGSEINVQIVDIYFSKECLSFSLKSIFEILKK
jgi:hypothetical protein